jgi:hypothetical protein
VPAPSASSITVQLPGYAAAYAVEGNTVNVTLTPELYPAEYAADDKHTTLTVDNSILTLEAAINTVTADTTDKWYIINFADDVSDVDLNGQLTLNTRGRFTIDGGSDVSVIGDFNIYVSDVRIIDLSFAGTNREQKAIQLRVPDDSMEKYDINNVYVLGCTFTNCFEVGVATCGAYGHAGTEYNGSGATNVSNLVFAGNTFVNTNLFSFAGAGDEDYNVIDGYEICGNTFTDCGTGMLAADAHTWYVYGYDSSQTAPKYCEHNILRNILVSGNSFTMTEAGTREYEGIIGIGCANLGNSNNLTENVEIRNNTSRITGGDKNKNSSVSISNASISDSYDGGKDYSTHVTSGMEHTDNNVLRHVSVHDNDFELGTGRSMQIQNVDVNVGEQCGKNNTMTDISICDNKIKARCGVRICNYTGNTDSGTCEGNDLSGVTFSGNTLSREGSDIYDVGLLVSASYISQNGHLTDDYPEYSGAMSGIDIKNNTVSGYSYGIIAAGAVGDYGKGLNLTDVDISGNTVTTHNWKEYPILDVGIAVTGAALPTNNDPTAHRGSIDCSVRDVKVTSNNITARTGVAVSGFLASEGIAYPWTGNRAENVTVSGNTIDQRVIIGSDNQRTAGVVTADVIEIWYKLGFSGKDITAMVGGNRISDVSVIGNIFTGFSTNEALYGGSFHTQVSQLDSGWVWIKQTSTDMEGKPFDRYVDGEYAVKRAVNDLWVYQTYSVGYDCMELGLTRVGNAVGVDWSTACGFACYVALYDAEGRMMSVLGQNVDAGGEANTLSFSFDAAQMASAAFIRAFMLDPSTHVPLTYHIELTAGQ